VATVDADDFALPDGASVICSQVPGSVWKVQVHEGDVVAEGDTLVVVESMKMEFAVTAPFAGRVSQIRCAEGAAVGAGQKIVVLMPAEACVEALHQD
jgi:urea carboxylase